MRESKYTKSHLIDAHQDITFGQVYDAVLRFLVKKNTNRGLFFTRHPPRNSLSNEVEGCRKSLEDKMASD